MLRAFATIGRSQQTNLSLARRHGARGKRIFKDQFPARHRRNGPAPRCFRGDGMTFKTSFGSRTMLAGCLAAILFAGGASAADAPAGPEHLAQGWDASMRELFYWTAQGSRLLPYDLAMALEADDGSPFFGGANLARYGYLPGDGASAHNPDNLPVGFVREDDAERGPALGMTCAACHTNEITYRGARLRIDGAPALSDYTAMMTGLQAALDATIADRARLTRLAGKLGATDAAGLLAAKAKLESTAAAIRRLNAGNWSPVAYGRGRLDAFGQILNAVTADALHQPLNGRAPSAPVSYPFLWTTPQQRFAQWNGAAGNPIGRNLGEVLGVFGQLDLPPARTDFTSTGRMQNLLLLEAWVDRLQPPPWPTDLFGPINQRAAARGKALFAANCESCHMGETARLTDPAENLRGLQFLKVTMTPLPEVGTDPTALTNFYTRSAVTGALDPALGLKPVDLGGSVLVSLVGQLIGNFFVANATSPADQAAYFGGRFYSQPGPDGRPQPYGGWTGTQPDRSDLLAYKAGPLGGIWATAPYLHNGSVPNLYALLSPEAERPRRFLVGANAFNPTLVGFVSTQRYLTSSQRAMTTLFDTTLPGNSNAGHSEKTVYSRVFTPRERLDLIEYIKTLGAPRRP